MNGEEVKITVVSPAFNEEKTVGSVVRQAMRYADEVIVVDDGSWDKTAENASREGAVVISHGGNKGYIAWPFRIYFIYEVSLVQRHQDCVIV